MCGLTGIFRWDSKPVDRALLKRMADCIQHRGPDDEGFYLSDPAPVQAGLGFRRLSIIDLSGGHQPMSTENGNWIVFNGEIYNYLELKTELEKGGAKFKTRSDTEAILRAYEAWGKDCVKRLRGMFAFAIWDARKKSIFMARDRAGKKPLFYCKTGNSIYFASEMKALLQAPEVPRRVNTDAIPLYLTYQFIPGPLTIFQDIHRLPPAHTLMCDAQGNLHVEQYWKLSRKPDTTRSFADTCEQLRHELDEATRIRLMSEVPLGAFLSGGVDSSAVVGAMSRNMKEPVKTFSIGFDEADFSELKFAKLTAEHFKTDHHEFVVKPNMADVLPKLAWHYDQPFADPSALPSYYVANETRKHVTVALNGDGGDENFGGYLRYQADRIFLLLQTVPSPLRKAAAAVLGRMPRALQKKHLARRIARAGTLLGLTPEAFNLNLFCYFEPENLHKILAVTPSPKEEHLSAEGYFPALYKMSDNDAFLDQVFACDQNGYLPDCLLVKMDIASMANSLEARSPLLDHKLMEFAASIPWQWKVKTTGGKHVFKEAMRGFVPDEILERRKMGFGVPLGQWFRGPLKDFLRDMILSAQARQRGYFKMEEVERLVNEHQSGQKDHGYKLWALMMFELWCKAYLDSL